MKPDDFPPRAPRFRMHLPLRYRSSESDAWLSGTTENVSATGVLFVVDQIKEAGTPIEMTLLMPKEILGRFTSRVICHGRVVRTVVPTKGGQLAMAATIASYRFARGNDETASVLHLISSAGFYGAENILVLLGRNLQRRGCRSIIGVFSDSRSPHAEVAEQARAQGLETEMIPCDGRLDWKAVRCIREILRRGVDVLHAHGYKANVYGCAAAWRGQVALVSTCHGLSPRTYASLDRLVLRRFDRVAAVADVLTEALKSSGIDPAKVTTISNGIEPERFRDAKPKLRAELGGAGRSIVGMVGRLAPEKGGDVMLRAALSVVTEFPDTTFVVVGEGPRRAEWESLSALLGLARHVVFTGIRRDMPEVYASLDAIVLPSLREGMPMCLLEAMAAARPVVATAVGSVDKLVIAGRTGLLVEPGDASGLAQAIRLLLRDPARARELGENGRAHVAANFSLDAMTRQYLQLYDEALTLRARRARRADAWEPGHV